MDSIIRPKVFISLPMQGRSLKDVLARRNQIYDLVKDEYDLIDSIFTEDSPEPDNRLWYLGKSLQQLGKADLVIFDKDWSKASGCRVELSVCKTYGIPFISVGQYEKHMERSKEILENIMEEEGLSKE